MRRTLGVVALALVALTACGAPPPGTPESVLYELKAGTRFRDVTPKLHMVQTEKGTSFANCLDRSILIAIPQSHPDFAWTVAHEWAHIVACPWGYQPPPGWPASPEVQPWAGSPVGWDAENWADCVALVLTGWEGGPARDYPPCTEDQRTFTQGILF